MSGKGERMSSEDLAAYLDGEMTPQRRAEMERHLAHSPEDAARLEKWRRRDMALRIGLPELAKAGERDLALQLRRRRDELHRHRNRRPMLRWAQAAAIVLVVGLGGGAWWLREEQNSSAELTHAAAAAYLAGTATMVPAGTAADRDQLTENIATHLGVHVAPPDLSKFGFSLAGGQLLPSSDHPAAQLIYVDARGRRISCFFRRIDTDRETNWEYSKAEGVPGIHRVGEKLGWVVLGDLPVAELQQIAEATYKSSSAE
jgi:anti-sigma factor RsiW